MGGVPSNGVAKFIGSAFQEACSTVGINEAASMEAGLKVRSPSPGTILLTGLADSMHDLRVYDAQGRLLLMKQVHSTGGRTEEMYARGFTNALYITRVDGVLTAKFIPLP